MTKGDATRRRVLDAALATASVQGLGALSLGPLAERAKLSKSGLFAHFESKEDLQLRVLDGAQEAFRRAVPDAARDAPRGLPRLRRTFELWLDWPRRSGLPGGCPFVAAAAEFDDVPGPVRDQLVASQKAWLAELRRRVQVAVSEGHLRPGTDAAQIAWDLMAAYLMHHWSARLLRAADARDRALAAFDARIAPALARP